MNAAGADTTPQGGGGAIRVERVGKSFTLDDGSELMVVRTDDGWRIAKRIEEQILLDGGLPGGAPAGD